MSEPWGLWSSWQMLQLWAQREAYSPLSRETATHQNAESCPAEVGHLSLRGSGLQVAVLWVGAEGLVSLSSLFMSVSVIYCCIIKHPRSMRFKEQFIIVPHSPVVTGLSWWFLLGGLSCSCRQKASQGFVGLQSGFFTHLSAPHLRWLKQSGLAGHLFLFI